MRITIVQGAFLPVPPLRGGAIEKAFHALAREFADSGHTVNYISRLCDGLPQNESEGSNLHHRRIQGHDTPKSLLKLKWLDLLYSLRARRKLPDADILVTHAFWLPMLARSPRRHGQLFVHVGRAPKGQMRLYKHAAKLQTVSSPIAGAIQNELPSRLSELAIVLPYPLDPAFLEIQPPEGPRLKRILYGGRMHPEKGLELLVRAFKKLPDGLRNKWALKFVGPWQEKHGGAGSAYMESMRSLTNASDNIQFQEPIFDQAALIREYDQAEAFVYPSLAEHGETFGLAALEAMSRGCLTIVSDLSCFKDFVRDGENAFSFDHRTANPVRSLVDKLVDLLQNHEKLNLTREKAVATAQAYSPRLVGKAFLEVFNEIVRRAG